MSTFGGLNIAYTGLVAARAALETTGQNVTNANTVGYTRQKVDQVALAPVALAGYSSQNSVGDGVLVTGISRTNDTVADARVRSTAGSAAYWNTTSDAISTVETSLNEPSSDGLGESMTAFSNAWQTLANNPGTSASANALIGSGQALAAKIATGYQSASEGWADARASTVSAVATINDDASQIASLNVSIRELPLAGSANVNTLMDKRDQLITNLAKLTGATTRTNNDGTIDVLVGGNAIVSNGTSRVMQVSGKTAFPPTTADPVQVVWSDNGSSVSMEGGEVAARVATLAAANSSGTGGVYGEAAAAYNTIATTIHDSVNYLSQQGTSSTGATNLDFFTYASTSGPAATNLAVLPTTVGGIAAADPAKGKLDNTYALAISKLGTNGTVATSSTTTSTAPADVWNDFVSRIGSQSAVATTRANTATAASSAATTAQTSSSGVDLDEETSNLVIYQHAYQASARVISTLSDVLDTLINMGAR